MTVNPITSISLPTSALQDASPKPPQSSEDEKQLREAFDNFVGETFFGQMLKAMRKTQGKPAYFHGGRTEEVFTAQLDQVLAEKMTAASAEKFSGPMFELFMARKGK
jgi:Rod binding domain-containing protein